MVRVDGQSLQVAAPPGPAARRVADRGVGLLGDSNTEASMGSGAGRLGQAVRMELAEGLKGPMIDGEDTRLVPGSGPAQVGRRRRGQVLEVMGQQKEPLGHLEAGGEKAMRFCGRESARDHAAVPAGRQVVQAVPYESRRRSRPVGKGGQVGHVSMPPPWPGPSPLPPPLDDVESWY